MNTTPPDGKIASLELLILPGWDKAAILVGMTIQTTA